MTDEQAIQLANLARALLPCTDDVAAALFKERVLPHEAAAVKAALKDEAAERLDGRLILGRLLARVNAGAAPPEPSAEERRHRAAEAAALQREEERRAVARAAESDRDARAFCAAHPAELEEWRRLVLDGDRFKTNQAAGKPTLEVVWLVSAIYERFRGAGAAVAMAAGSAPGRVEGEA